jgi:hypothetical protein
VAIAEYVQHALSVLYSFAQASLAKQSNSLTYCLQSSQSPPIIVMKIAMLFSSKMFVERLMVHRTLYCSKNMLKSFEEQEDFIEDG